MIPEAAAAEIAALDAGELPIAEIAARTRETAHSTLGFIQVLQGRLPPAAAEYVYDGTTVQDVTDTSLALEMQAVGGLLWRDLWRIEGDLLNLAVAHRDTPMAGRTHGQPGSPISFGFKAASWADEVGRHLQRLREGRPRWLVGQLAGAVGSLAFFGHAGVPVRRELCARLGLGEPNVSWLTSRDRIAELAHVAAMAATTLARIANEVYVLQRWELRELAEPTAPATVGSITMPHKRNPEVSEQIVTLARLARAQAAVLLESMVQEHERDARGWKAEWVAFPEPGPLHVRLHRLRRPARRRPRGRPGRHARQPRSGRVHGLRAPAQRDGQAAGQAPGAGHAPGHVPGSQALGHTGGHVAGRCGHGGRAGRRRVDRPGRLG